MMQEGRTTGGLFLSWWEDIALAAMRGWWIAGPQYKRQSRAMCTDASRLMDRVVGTQRSSLDGCYFLSETGSKTISWERVEVCRRRGNGKAATQKRGWARGLYPLQHLLYFGKYVLCLSHPRHFDKHQMLLERSEAVKHPKHVWGLEQSASWQSRSGGDSDWEEGKSLLTGFSESIWLSHGPEIQVWSRHTFALHPSVKVYKDSWQTASREEKRALGYRDLLFRYTHV